MVPATAGLAAAVVIFVVLMGFMAPLQADNSDVPLMLHTDPQLQQSAFGSALDSINDDSLVIEAYVDSKGRVQDYRILSDSKEDDPLLPQVKKNMLIFTTFTTFRPALSMGRPTTGRAILSFSRVSVKGNRKPAYWADCLSGDGGDVRVRVKVKTKGGGQECPPTLNHLTNKETAIALH